MKKDWAWEKTFFKHRYGIVKRHAKETKTPKRPLNDWANRQSKNQRNWFKEMYEQTINNDVALTGGENPLLAGRYQVVRQLGTGGTCPSIGDLQ